MTTRDEWVPVTAEEILATGVILSSDENNPEIPKFAAAAAMLANDEQYRNLVLALPASIDMSNLEQSINVRAGQIQAIGALAEEISTRLEPTIGYQMNSADQHAAFLALINRRNKNYLDH